MKTSPTKTTVDNDGKENTNPEVQVGIAPKGLVPKM